MFDCEISGRKMLFKTSGLKYAFSKLSFAKKFDRKSSSFTTSCIGDEVSTGVIVLTWVFSNVFFSTIGI